MCICIYTSYKYCLKQDKDGGVKKSYVKYVNIVKDVRVNNPNIKIIDTLGIGNKQCFFTFELPLVYLFIFCIKAYSSTHPK